MILDDNEKPIEEHEEMSVIDEDEGLDLPLPHEGQALVPTQPYPDQLYILPLNRRPFFPGMAAPIVIEPGDYYEVLKIVAKTEHKCVGLFLTHDEEANIYKIGLDDLYQVGVVARILRIIPLEQGGAQVVLNMEKRAAIVKPVKSKHMFAKVKYHDDTPLARLSKELKAYSISIITTIKELLKLNPLFKEELQIFLGHSDFTEPGRLADFAVALTTASRAELQEVLETFDIEKRIDKALLLLKKELDISKLQSTINQRIEATISKTQREFFLREQLKAIKKELGMEKEDKALEIEKFEERLKARVVPDDVMKVIREEIDKLSALEAQSAEYGVCRNYVDWLTIIPW
ncbi:MAG: LON peptidase substrate-binding domain-containing protein, partial [Chlamydiia bacterium]|nr:LON peptidase substrate-binding domain-containing protein [Chlamydiia bacterium]